MAPTYLVAAEISAQLRAAAMRDLVRGPATIVRKGQVIVSNPDDICKNCFATSAASSYVCLGNDAVEPFVVGVVVAPDDVPADHAGLFGVAAMVGAVQREVPQRRELRFYAVNQEEFVGV
jgi:hypothetical protein